MNRAPEIDAPILPSSSAILALLAPTSSSSPSPCLTLRLRGVSQVHSMGLGVDALICRLLCR